MIAASVLAKADRQQHEEGNKDLTSNPFAVTITRRTETEIRGIVQSGDKEEYGVTLFEHGTACSCTLALSSGAICKHAVMVALQALCVPNVSPEEDNYSLYRKEGFRFQRLQNEWECFEAYQQKLMQLVGAQEKQQESALRKHHATLVREFGKWNIDVDREILPLFIQRRDEFTRLFFMKKAWKETLEEFRKNLKRYERAYRLLIEEASPFPEDVKIRLQMEYENLPKADLRDKRLQQMEEQIEKRLDVKILDRNLKKDPYKHPVWRHLEAELFKVLKQHEVTDRQAYKLMARLFELLIPLWFTPKHPEDAIRLHIGRQLKKP